jgi:hypothetical protein
MALTGCGRKQTDMPARKNESRHPAPDPGLMQFLKGMYEVHGAKAELAGDWVVVDGGKLRTRAVHFNHRQFPQGLVLQTNVVSVLPSGERIVLLAPAVFCCSRQMRPARFTTDARNQARLD